MMSAMTRHLGRHWVTSLVALMALLLVACGAASKPAEAPKAKEPAPAKGVAAQPAAIPTPAPKVAAPPAAVKSAKTRAIVVTEAEPASVGSWTQGCSGEIHSLGCQEFTQDYLNWIDSKTFEVVLMSGFDSWEQVAPNRWRYKIRQGVKFHNGEPFNAEAAKLALDWNGVGSNPGNSLSYTGITKGEVVDEYTVDAVCPAACPIMPRGGIWVEFMAPKWWATASEADKNRVTMGYGPYKTVGYQPGVETRFEIYEGYLPTKHIDSQAPTIKNISHIYRAEALVRAAMLTAGEADWAADIGFDTIGRVPQAKVSGTTEVYALVLDLMWHPELKKQKVRLALAHAIDCQGLLDSLFGGKIKCHAAIAPRASVGITAENSRPRTYDPDLARKLLKEAGYDPKNEINVNTRPGSNIRGLEIMEASVSYWRAVGVNSKLNSWGDLGKARDIQLSGCGQFTKEPGFTEKWDCAQRSPPGPYFANSHAYEIATSDEILDLQRQSQARMGCLGRSSRVCFPDVQKKINEAVATAVGPERQRKMQEIADQAYQDVWFIPFFEVQMVYGLGKDLDWEPLYAPRLRGNTMKWLK